jgi:hypothetical protein
MVCPCAKIEESTSHEIAGEDLIEAVHVRDQLSTS